MFTEQSLRDHPSVVKAFMGLSADHFWERIHQMQDRCASYTVEHRQRAERQRAIGAGRPLDLPLAIRTAAVLTYLRLHIPQTTVAALFVGATQSAVSRDLRRLLPLIQACLPCPVVWGEVAEEAPGPTITPTPKGGALTISAVAGVGMISVGVLGIPLLGTVQDKFLDQHLAAKNPALHEQITEPPQPKYGLTFQPPDKTKIAPMPAPDKAKVEYGRSAHSQTTATAGAVARAATGT